MKTCGKCGHQSDEMFNIREKGELVGYECVDEAGCSQRQRENRARSWDAIEAMREQYATLSEDEQLQQRFGISMDELDIDDAYTPNRDGMRFYPHTRTGETYIWSMAHHIWIPFSKVQHDPIYAPVRYLSKDKRALLLRHPEE